jgi:mono/diheme cytochrome c family protein
MRPQTFAAAIAIALGSAACVGQLNTMGDDQADDDDAPQSEARRMFEEQVSPMLTAACASCHQGPIESQPPKYLGNTGAAGYYDAVVAEPSVIGGFDPALANLINKGLHDNGNARAWTTDEAGVMTSWLLAEADERGIDTDPNPNPGTTTPTTSREALAQWSACMSIDDWTTSNVANWADKGSERGQCMSCHNQGAGGFYATANDTEMYNMNKYEIYITTFFTAAPKSITDPSQGYTVLVNEQKLRLKANSVGHPSYNPDGGNQLQNLRNFYDLTMARMNAGTCPPGGFPEAPPAP